MCYLCLGSSPFSPINQKSPIEDKKARMVELKKIIQEAEDSTTCPFGDTVIEALKREQYRLSREM